VWTIDCKANQVGPGETATPECTLDLSDADFMLMCTGKADPQQLFTGGKLKIGGNLMASMKLGFLKKLDPELVLAAMRARIGGAAEPVPAAAEPVAATTTTTTATTTAAATKPAQAPAIADKLASKLAGSKQDQALTLQLRITEPTSAWVLRLGPDGGSISAGEAAQPDATLTLADDDLLALAHGKASAQSLFQRGQLRVDGDARLAHHLSLLAGAL
jgi:3-hydroxyacyl-CoA dehydrogenase/3a,7a,12a-trihydroxy-5b-cholest-24-enoyl-CoA hydratase